MRKATFRIAASVIVALMTFSSFSGIRKPVAAENGLLIATRETEALKTLVITKEMIDSDGEFVLSGEDFDVVTLLADANATVIYLDNAKIKNFVAENGCDTVVKIWNAEIDQVNVLSPKDVDRRKLLKEIIADGGKIADNIEAYQSRISEMQSLTDKTLVIETKENAKITEMLVSGNAELNLAEGITEKVKIQSASLSDHSTLQVKISAYENGSVEVNNEGENLNGAFSRINLSLKNSFLNSLNLSGNARGNCNVQGDSSSISEVMVEGSSGVSLGVLSDKVLLAEKGNTNVTLLSEVNQLVVNGEARISVGACGRVENAAIVGDNVRFTGDGAVKKTKIDGKYAYVSVNSAKIEGENTYKEPVFVESPYDSYQEDFSADPANSFVMTDGSSMNWASYKYDATEKFGVVETTAGWQGICIKLDNRDNGASAEYVINANVKKIGGTATAFRMTTPPGCSAAYMNPVDANGDWQRITSSRISVPAETVLSVIIATNGESGGTMNYAVDDISIKRYTEWTKPAEKPLPKEDIEYDFTQMTYNSGYGNTYSVDANGALTVNFDGQYQEIKYSLPKTVNTKGFLSFIINSSTEGGAYALKFYCGGSEVNTQYGISSSSTKNFAIDLETLQSRDIDMIGIMANDGASRAVINKIVFSVKGVKDLPEDKPGPQEGVFSFNDLTYKGGYGNTYEVNADGVLAVNFDGQYQEIQYEFKEAAKTNDYSKLILNGKTDGGAIALKINDAAGTSLITQYGLASVDDQNFEIDLSGYPDKEIKSIGIMANESASKAVLNKVTLIKK